MTPEQINKLLDDYNDVLFALLLLILVLLVSGCSAHKPVAKRDLQPPAPYCDGKNPCKCEGEFVYSEYKQGCEPR